jgi:hypothetical protein
MRRALPVANLENMKEAFADMIRHDDRVSIHGLAPKFRDAERGTGDLPGNKDVFVGYIMDVANKKLQGFGVEAISGEYVNSFWQTTVALYVNQGDTYAPTIIYDVIANRFYVGGYGDWVEWRESNKNYGLGEFHD